jgi:hypothetical protein
MTVARQLVETTIDARERCDVVEVQPHLVVQLCEDADCPVRPETLTCSITSMGMPRNVGSSAKLCHCAGLAARLRIASSSRGGERASAALSAASAMVRDAALARGWWVCEMCVVRVKGSGERGGEREMGVETMLTAALRLEGSSRACHPSCEAPNPRARPASSCSRCADSRRATHMIGRRPALPCGVRPARRCGLRAAARVPAEATEGARAGTSLR